MSEARGPRERIRVALLLDEMHAPAVAEALRRRGHDVIAVAERLDLRAMTDPELLEWAGRASRRIVTENVKDFRRLHLRADEATRGTVTLLYTSSRVFQRSRRNPGPLIEALHAWLRNPDVGSRPAEDWLRPTRDG